MYKPLESILDNFYENRFLLIEALYVVNLPSVHCQSRGYWNIIIRLLIIFIAILIKNRITLIKMWHIEWYDLRF